MKLKKNKGFTLIELLAVIVIIAVVGLIVVPILATIIKDAKIAAEKSSVDGILSAMENARIYTESNNSDTEILDKLNYKGKKPDEIYLTTKDATHYAVRIVYGNNCYIKISGEKIKSYSKDKCPPPNYSTVFKQNIDNIQDILNNETGINTSESADYVNSKVTQNGDVYVYQGADPANYLVLGDSCFRIVSYDNDNIKIVYDGDNNNQTSANPCSHMYNGSIGRIPLGGFIDYLKFGSNQNWLDENNNIRTMFESIVNDDTINSEEDIILGNPSKNIITIAKDEKKHLKKGTYYIGGIKDEDTMTITDDAIDIIEQQEKSETYNNYVGLLTLSEYLNASSDPDCKNYKSGTNTCDNDNYLPAITPTSTLGAWTMNKMTNSTNVFYYPFMVYNYNCTTPFFIKPVLILKGDTIFTGSGTYYNPYRIMK